MSEEQNQMHNPNKPKLGLVLGSIRRTTTSYKERNYREAQVFMDNITHYLNLPEKKVLDLACGKGRHSIYLNQLGFDVLGADF
jgi:2-polyprenyl-3-methyl-5-hydroxy-6-metoxy-1,4-benzoquinol methylase